METLTFGELEKLIAGSIEVPKSGYYCHDAGKMYEKLSQLEHAQQTHSAEQVIKTLGELVVCTFIEAGNCASSIGLNISDLIGKDKEVNNYAGQLKPCSTTGLTVASDHLVRSKILYAFHPDFKSIYQKYVKSLINSVLSVAQQTIKSEYLDITVEDLIISKVMGMRYKPASILDKIKGIAQTMQPVRC